MHPATGMYADRFPRRSPFIDILIVIQGDSQVIGLRIQNPSSWSKEQIWAYFVSFADLP